MNNIPRRTKPETQAEKLIRIRAEAVEAEEAVRRYLHEQSQQITLTDTLNSQQDNMPVAGGLEQSLFTNVISFSGNPLTVVGPGVIVFTNSSPLEMGGAFLYDFGDGTTANGAFRTVHTYSTTGSMTVSLAHTNSLGLGFQLTKPDYITVNAPTLTSAFTFTSGSAVAPATGTFVNNSSYNGHGVVTGSWSYGDGTSRAWTASVNPPTKVYGTGSWTASLQLTESSYNIKSGTSTQFRLVAPTVVSSFSLNSSSFLEPSNVSVTSSATYNGHGTTSSLWNFVTGSTLVSSSNGSASFVGVFNSGIYTASLQVTESSYNIMSVTNVPFEIST